MWSALDAVLLAFASFVAGLRVGIAIAESHFGVGDFAPRDDRPRT